MPTLAVVPPFDWSDIRDVVDLTSSYGLVPDLWQVTVLEALFARLGNSWAATDAGVAVPRQNGKNSIIEIVELARMVLMGRRILHTAHEVKTCRKAFNRLLGFFDNRRQYPELADLVRVIRKTNGQESIELTNGGSIEFIARSNSSGRGYTVDDLVMDEAQELTDEQQAALLPTVSASPSGDPQVLLFGTPPVGVSVRGEAFTRRREAAQGGTGGRLAWVEWAAEEGVDLDDPATVARVNPAVGTRISWSIVEAERAGMGDEQFARERCGVWNGVSVSSVIDLDVWASFRDDSWQAGGVVAFAVDVPPDGRRASIARAASGSDDTTHVEVDCREGTTWAVEQLADLLARRNAVVVVDGGSRAASLIERLRARGVEPVVYGTRDVVTACSEFMDLVDERALRHSGQVELALAVEAARRRKVGDAWAWHRRDTSVDISPLVAATLAVRGLKESPPRRRTGRVLAV